VQLVLVGTGNSAEELQEEAKMLGLGQHITWIQRFDNQSPLLNQLYHLASMFCIPSTIETESIVTMEAMASGLPILAANAGALPELVADGENGYLLPPDDSKAWAEAIVRLIKDSELAQKLGENSIERIAQRDLAATLDQFEGLYQEYILKKKVDRAVPA